jgi:hypothetical protein
VVDLGLRRFPEDVGGSHLVFSQLTVLGTEGEVPVPSAILAQKCDKKACPGLLSTLEEGYGSAAKAVQDRGAPGFLKKVQGIGG